MCRNHCRIALEAVAWIAILLTTPAAVLAAPQPTPQATPEAIVLENEVCRYEIGRDGKNRAMRNLADKKDYLRSATPLMRVGRAEQHWDSSRVELTGDLLSVSFAGCDARVKAKLEIRPKYFTLCVTEVSGSGFDWLQFCNLQVKMTQKVGVLVNAAWDDDFAVCVLACNDRTDCGSHGVPTARAYREFGFEGAKAAIIGVATGKPDPAARLLDAIEIVELEQGLPHPTIGGVWTKRAPQRFASYLMVGSVNQRNIDQVVEFAKGGFGCVEIFWNARPPPTTRIPNYSPMVWPE